MISDDDLRDHFERQYAQGGPSAGIALAVLDLFDQIDAADELADDVLINIGDLKEARESLDAYESLTAWAENDGLVSEQPGETLQEQLKWLVDKYRQHEEISCAVSELAAEADLIASGDYETDPLPLIRMFLPIEGD